MRDKSHTEERGHIPFFKTVIASYCEAISVNVPFLLLLVVYLLSQQNAYAEMFSYKNQFGKTVYTNIPQVKDTKYAKLIAEISMKHDIDAALIDSIIKVESNHNQDAVSKSGAKGLMQLMTKTAKELNVANIYDPKDNIDGGVKYLKYLTQLFDGDLKLVLAAYNGGLSNVQKYKGVPPFPETKKYIKKVLKEYYGNNQLFISKNDDGKVPKSGTIVIYKYKDKDGKIRYSNTKPSVPEFETVIFSRNAEISENS